jgi:predicted enzyme related to lactoylglutathione lyase
VEAASPGSVLRSVVFDCPDPTLLAEFYAALLGGRADTGDITWCEVYLDHPPKLAFQLVENYEPPQWPDGVPQQLHLDLTVPDLEEASRHAVALGARVLSRPVDEDGSSYMVHADPAGHPFCFVRGADSETAVDIAKKRT